MELARFSRNDASTGTTVQLLGQPSLWRNAASISLPPSRKVRALLAYLALSPHPVGRSRLCDLLGDVSNDPRGELRWCLSRLRTILDEPGQARVIAEGETIRLDLSDCLVDALEIEAARRAGLETLRAERLRELADMFVGQFLEGLTLGRSPQLDHWVAAQRRQFAACHAAIMEALAKLIARDPAALRAHAERWVELAPLDARPQVLLLRALLEGGEWTVAERQMKAAMRLFEAEDVDTEPVRRAWRELQAIKRRISHVAGTIPAAVGVTAESALADVSTNPVHRRASLAVMPFADPDRIDGQGRLCDGLTHDVITRLAKLRALFVIARGSVFALAESGLGPEEAARRLNVDYFASGTLRRHGAETAVAVELVEARTARIIWSEEFDLESGEAFLVLDRIGDLIVASVAAEIETAEKNRAILKAPESLDAWEAYHRGLWHMYRFTMADNDLAQRFFRQSITMDPTFARAHASLSFTHWQSAFQHWSDPAQEADLALAAAGRSLLSDDHDPAAHWAMGRALWLKRKSDEAIVELERAVELSPNFALGHYALSFVHSQNGEPSAAIAASDQSRSLSPFDPLLFGMLGARAMAHVRLEQFEEAAEWALKAASRPNAHNIILAIAALCLALAGRVEEGKLFAATIRRTLPSYCIDDFLNTFAFSPDAESLFRHAGRQVGLG